jgi:hypothetical protein
LLKQVEILTFEVEDYRREPHKIEKFVSNDDNFSECKQLKNSTHKKPSCCKSHRACALGSFESIYQVMKESHSKPHSNKLTKSKLANNHESLITKILSEFPLTMKNLTLFHQENQFPFIPMCKTFGKWGRELSFVAYQYTDIAWCRDFQPGR